MALMCERIQVGTFMSVCRRCVVLVVVGLSLRDGVRKRYRCSIDNSSFIFSLYLNTI